MTDWERELLQFVAGTPGVLLSVVIATAGVYFVIGMAATDRLPLHLQSSSAQRSPLQRWDGLIIVAILFPLAVCQLVSFHEEETFIAYGSSVVFVGVFCLLMALLASNWRTTFPVFVVALLLPIFHKPMGRDILLSPRPKRPPFPPLYQRIRISAAGDLPGVDLWLDGERIDSLPLEIKTADLAMKVPERRSRQDLPGYRRLLYEEEFRCLNEWYAHTRHREMIGPWGYFHFRFDDENGRNVGKSPRVGATIDGVQVFAVSTVGDDDAGAAVVFDDNDNMRHVVLDVRTRQWEKELTLLADIARVNNYEVDSAWCDAVLSYQPRGWYYVRELVPFEPQFRGILDQLARRAYRVDEIGSTRRAWKTLLDISECFIDRGHFDSRSLEARALEFVATKVSPHRLTAECGKLLVKDYDRLVGYVHGRGGRVTWLTADEQYSPGRIRKTVFGYAAWCLDKALDEQNPDHENVLEKWLTPRLLRHGDHQSARIIGGPAWQDHSDRNPNVGKHDLEAFTDLSGIGFNHQAVRGAFRSFIERREIDFRKNGPQHLRELMEFDRYHDDAVELLVEHPNVEFRSAALLAIRYHPTPHRRRVLERLLEDEDPRIKAEADECRRQFDELHDAPLPHRKIPGNLK